ncbi:glucosamine/fructose-6-phosphate aminotransferase, isomerizing [Thermocrinis albus DSM 14484]|uniref:Glutamine--fructose-6-phosphate aminotransferase [isomerizing] n=1 Tax=Thermocrinis albus (strain DSM 14484 / JCM 11386 / HI 11/12) TaxID=638303 RepID=D3SNQ6_THEAH|nr:glutamine--fructose-6-phosphate transaminase (isomerizing) [Thermocrinis albus]ADC88793.1 glucosamine/fructose-6-phosphate aminotransferase, isomerizing [Thermocrinis albus DSM 14484]
MCGIVGYTGRSSALLILLEALERLEYRGYDSSGVAIIEKGKLFVEKKVGKIRELVRSLWGKTLEGTTGIGHTRWATHGGVCELNAHPHIDFTGEFALVHNGIIENYMELKEFLRSKGVEYKSETDTEAIVHLVSLHYKGDLLQAVMSTLPYLKGAYAFAVITTKEPNRIVAVRYGSPLVVGLGEDGNMIASDIPALLPLTRKVIPLDDGEVVDVTPEGVVIYDTEGNVRVKDPITVTWDIVSAEKAGFKHFMLKEIFEGPRVIGDTLSGFVSRDYSLPFSLKDFRRVIITACGTSYHAGLIAKYWIEKYAQIPVEVAYASEFRYSDTPVGPEDLVIAISQSGETADTRFSALSAKEKGATLVSVVNVVGSALSRESDYTLYTHAGPEIGVAATKTFLAQLTVLYSLAAIHSPDKDRLMQSLMRIPSLVEKVLAEANYVREIALKYAHVKSVLYLGRYLSYPVAMEGALKLKEISYIHAEGLPAGEMKHGPIALIDDSMPVVVVAPHDRVYEKVISNIEEVLARKGKVISVGFEGDKQLEKLSLHFIPVPAVEEDLTPFLTVVPLQLMAYYIADYLGLDVDQPRNLAKTVTVE